MCLEQRNLIKKCVYQKGQQTTGGIIYKEPLIAAPNHLQTMLLHLQK